MTAREVDADLLDAWPLPKPASHKNARGSVAVVGGSESTPGSVLLAGEAALRVGAGKLSLATVTGSTSQLAVALPEAAVSGFATARSGDLDAAEADAIADFVSGADAVLLGSGFVDPDDAARLLAALVPRLEQAIVIDALGSAYVGRGHDLGPLAGRCVLTVNPHELAHVLGRTDDEVSRDQEGSTAAAAERSGMVVVNGGEQKFVSVPGRDLYVVRGGGPGLGVSGSGDVHAGLVAGLLARTGDPAQSAVWGAWLHATAGDHLAGEVGEVGFLARELSAVVPRLLAHRRTGS